MSAGHDLLRRAAANPEVLHWSSWTALTPGPALLVLGAVHGNEVCGAWAIKGLLEAGVRPRQGRLTLAFCNLAAFDRFDPANHDASRFVDEDLNRQWSPDRIAAGGTLERRRAAALRPFVEQADWLLDLHSMHEPGQPLALVMAFCGIGAWLTHRLLIRPLAHAGDQS